MKETHLFLSLFDTGDDLRLGGECLILCRIDLILSEDRKGGFVVEFLDPNLA